MTTEEEAHQLQLELAALEAELEALTLEAERTFALRDELEEKAAQLRPSYGPA